MRRVAEASIEAFLVSKSHYTRHTARCRRHHLTHLLEFLATAGIPSIRDVTAPVLRAYLTYLRTVRRFHPNTIRSELLSLRAYYAWLVQTGQRQDDPAAGLAAPIMRRNIVTLSPDELTALRTAARASATDPLGLRDYAMISLACEVGLSAEEWGSLTTADVRLDQGAISVAGRHPDHQTIPLSPETIEAVASYLRYARPCLECGQGSDALFLSTRGRALVQQRIYLMLQRYALRAGITTQVSARTIRNSCPIAQAALAAANRESIRKGRRNWQKRNPERAREKARERMRRRMQTEEGRAAKRAQDARYRRERREQRRAYQQSWEKNHRAQRNAYKNQWKTKKRAAKAAASQNTEHQTTVYHPTTPTIACAA